MVAFLCRHYGWMPDYVLKKLSFTQAFIFYDKAIEQKMLENGQKPGMKTLNKKQHKEIAEKIVNDVDRIKKRIKDKQYG